ncbi:MAG: DUF4129 domain-containing protein [Thermomicrobiales bacterium]|nr:DUF4129 domain-containing protein [Thermomicrobiales bacterium]
MQSNTSNSSVSRQRIPWFDPTFSLLPIFIGALRIAPLAPFVAMFLSPDFGLSGGYDSPSVWWLVILGAAAFWCVRLLPRWIANFTLLNVVYLIIGIGGWIAWMAIEPDWPIMDVLRAPFSIFGSNGEFVWTFLITIVYWVTTLRIALDARERSGDLLRETMMRALVAILAGAVLAALIGGEMGDAGIHAAFQALPVALVAGIGAVGVCEMGETRAAARRRGTTVPGWSRWLRTFGGSSVILLAIVFIAILVFGPGFIKFALDVMRETWNIISTLLIWIMYGFIYAVVLIWRAIAWFFGLFFHIKLSPIEMPEASQPDATPAMGPPMAQAGDFPFAEILRVVVVVGGVIVGLALLFRFARSRGQDDGTAADEERESVFSGSLLRNQLRNLFRRNAGAEKPRKIDLASDPESVREGMLYLQVLASRLDIARVPSETAHDFTNRLATEWPQLREPLLEINRRYEHVRYGETNEDRQAVVTAWRAIWQDRQSSLQTKSS